MQVKTTVINHVKVDGALSGFRRSKDGREVFKGGLGKTDLVGDGSIIHKKLHVHVLVAPVRRANLKEGGASLAVLQSRKLVALPSDRYVKGDEAQIAAFELAPQPSFQWRQRPAVLCGVKASNQFSSNHELQRNVAHPPRAPAL